MSRPPPLPHELPPKPRALSRPFFAAIASIGLVQLVLSIVTSGHDPGSNDGAYRFGLILGASVIWPLFILGLFSIPRRLRTPQCRAIVVGTVWGIFILSHAIHLKQHSRLQAAARATEAIASAPHDAAPSASAALSDDATALELGGADPARDGGTIEDDFSAGSDQRLIASIERVQEKRYHAIVAAYRRACAARPQDAVLALEWVNFTQRFHYAEDVTIESAAADHEAAVAYLTARFPTAPETILYQLRNIYDPEFESKVHRYVLVTDRWNAADRARFLLLRANAASVKSDSANVRFFARQSFDLDPTLDAALLLANASHALNRSEECLEILAHPLFESAEPWRKKRKMELLFELGQRERAVALYEELVAEWPAMPRDNQLAFQLAEAGDVDAGRSLLAARPVNDWTRASIHRSRFEYELKFGDPKSAEVAYRVLRTGGLREDPLLRDRAALGWKQRVLAWNWDDCVGALVLGAVLIGSLVSPLLFLAPIHYWSLLRQRRGKRGAWPHGRWGLRAAWFTLGLMVVANVIAIWIYEPEAMRSWWNENAVEATTSSDALLARQTFVWAALGVTLTAMLWRSRGWRLLGIDRWSTGKAIGVGLAAALILRICAALYVTIFPGLLGSEIASGLSPQTTELCRALVKAYGPWGAMGALALLVPLLEEVLFRGVLLQAFARHVPFGWANAGQAALFAAVHENIGLFPFFFLFGLVCGELTRRSGTLLPAIVLHVANNLIAGFVLLTLQRSGF